MIILLANNVKFIHNNSAYKQVEIHIYVNKGNLLIRN